MHSKTIFCASIPGYRSGLILIVVAAILFSLLPAQAVMPPEVYARASREAKLKAIAIVEEVQTISVGRHYNSKRAIFRLEYGLTGATPDLFTGTCKSIETKQQKANIMVGGTIYFYPHKGQRVFVTISENGGSITSMTPMTSALEDVIRNEPSRLRYGFSEVRIEPAMPTPQLRGKGTAPTQADPMSTLEDYGQQQQDPNQTMPKRQSAGHGYADPNGKMYHDFDINQSQGQLLVAIGFDDADEVRRLLTIGASPNKLPGNSDLTPLMVVQSPAMARLLMYFGADPKAKDGKGGTLLHYAVTHRDAPQLIEIFTFAGVDPDMAGWDNEPPIFVLMDYFNETKPFKKAPRYDRALLSADYNGPDPEETLSALIAAGANINVKNAQGDTPLMLATSRGNAALADLLLQLGAVE